MWVPVTTAWRVLRLRVEEQPPIWRVAPNILNKQSLTADKRWYSSLGVALSTNRSSFKNWHRYETNRCFGPELILWYDVSRKWDVGHGMDRAGSG